MKNLFLLLLLVSSLTFTACGDDEAMPEPTTPFMTATVDGQAFEATSLTAIGDDSFGEVIVFNQGTNAAGNINIGVNVPISTPLNSAQAIDATDFALLYGTDDEDAAYFTVGSITVTEIDTEMQTMRGTFNFTATNSDDDTDVVVVTDGEFFTEYMQ